MVDIKSTQDTGPFSDSAVVSDSEGGTPRPASYPCLQTAVAMNHEHAPSSWGSNEEKMFSNPNQIQGSQARNSGRIAHNNITYDHK